MPASAIACCRACLRSSASTAAPRPTQPSARCNESSPPGGPGQQAIVERLLELVVATSLRDALGQPGSGVPAWYHAHDDIVVGAVLRMLHEQPAEPWTLASLARRLAVSRSTLARRFTELVGEPPMGYLACWRICLAADLLRDTDDTVASIARQVGYANA